MLALRPMEPEGNDAVVDPMNLKSRGQAPPLRGVNTRSCSGALYPDTKFTP